MQPTETQKRWLSLDILRGIALLGIVIANMIHFSTPYLYVDPHSFYSSPVDALTYKWVDILIEGSFYPIFALLFGYGINMQYEKSQTNNKDFIKTSLKRYAILMVVGLFHALFIWSGDILFTYALFGFLMIVLVRIPRYFLLVGSIILYVIPAVFLTVVTKWLIRLDPTSFMEGFVDIQKIELAITAYAHGNYFEAFQFRVMEWLQFGLLNSLFSFFIIVPFMMLGASLSKFKMIEESKKWTIGFISAAVVLIPAGLWLKALPHRLGFSYDLDLLQTLFGGPLLGFGYVALLLFLLNIPFIQKVFSPFAAVGKMSLTIYLTQSIIATLIFYGYGFGLYGQLDLATGNWIAIGIYLIQLIVANLYLQKYQRGPFEAIWRKLTYR